MKRSETRIGLIATAFAVAAGMVALPATSGAADQLPGKGITVKIAQPDDDTGWILSEIYGQMLEKLGYTVPAPITLAIPVAYQAVSQGTADIYPDGWFPLHNTYTDTPGFNAKPVGYVAKAGALQGYLIDKKTADEHDIKYLEDMKKPEIAKLFDTDGNGKANLVACPPGWGCEELIAYQMDAYKLHDSIDLIKAGYSASMADALGRYKNGEPIFFYTWTPNWTVGLLKPGKDVVWLQVKEVKLPPEQESLKAAATVKDVAGCADNPCVMGMPANDIRVVANNEFLKENPAAKTLLQEASVPVDFVFKQNKEMHDGASSPEDLKRQAAEWIEANREKVDSWLADARASSQKGQ